MAVRTAQDVLNRAGLAGHSEYEDVALMTDSAGFYCFRRYSPTSPLAKIVTADGRPAVRCYLMSLVK